MRERDKKSYPQFSNRILEWRSSDWNDGKICIVRVVAVDYSIGATLVNVNDSKDFFTCINGPLSPVGRIELVQKDRFKKYDISFGYLLDVLRHNKVYDVDEKYKLTGESGFGFAMTSCSFM